jgi:hypothetical protein
MDAQRCVRSSRDGFAEVALKNRRIAVLRSLGMVTRLVKKYVTTATETMAMDALNTTRLRVAGRALVDLAPRPHFASCVGMGNNVYQKRAMMVTRCLAMDVATHVRSRKVTSASEVIKTSRALVVRNQTIEHTYLTT